MISQKMAERKVPIPVIAGKITKAKRKAGVYVLYELERVYDAKKKLQRAQASHHREGVSR